MVRNVAFQARPKEIRELFSPFGSVKAVRIPKKFDGKSRGYAFVEYATKQEAKAAMEALSHSHLYGRRLVVEYAAEDKSLEEVREKTRKQFQQAQ